MSKAQLTNQKLYQLLSLRISLLLFHSLLKEYQLLRKLLTENYLLPPYTNLEFKLLMKLCKSRWTWKRRQCMECLWRGEWQTTKITHHISQEEKSQWIKTKLSPTRKKGRFTINKGQSTKRKPSFNDTCFFCKKHGHWKNVMNWNRPLSKCGVSK